MKTISKFLSIALVTVALLAMAPSTTSAVAVDSATICAKVPTLESAFESAFDKRLATMTTDFTTRLGNISNRSTTVDPKVATLRADAATKFDQSITTLEATPNLTDTQKSAISAYQTQMKDAEKTRENAVDAARDTYRTQLTATVKAHQTTLTAAVTTFKSAVVTAFSTATTSCTDATALATLKTNIKTARTAFTTAQQSSKVTDQIKTLAATRDAAIKAADDAFSQTATTYTNGLKTVIAGTDSTNS